MTAGGRRSGSRESRIPNPESRPRLAALAVAPAALALVTAMLWAPWRAAAPPRVTRTTITTSGPAALTINGTDRDLALSPDGTHVVYVGNSGTQLFVRALDALEPVAIASGGALRGPFVSPDGQWVGFLRHQQHPEGRDHGRPADHARPPRRQSPAARRGRPTTRSSSRPTTRRRGCSACRPPGGRPRC